ncbi:MAG TPA: bifunctional riboflavin kinase/FAD synthetase [Mycobacteriales bacterium]|nr:bifunctional riboflavin kinase/FAD synthetase [Mycobacteriales bacterium]
MQVWRALEAIPDDWAGAQQGAVVSIGVFDGVHRGHRTILDRAVAAATQRDVPSVVVTFDPHPAAVVGRPVPLMLGTLHNRARWLAEVGIDALLILPFSREMSERTPAEFVRLVLVDALHAVHVVVGENFRFGHKQAGDVTLLASLGARDGFTVDAVPLLRGAGEPFSSTWIRTRLAEGDVAAAAEGLGRPHRVEGPVVRGDARGKQLGYPTANVDVMDGMAVPADGVYAGWLVLPVRGEEQGQGRRDGARLPAAISIGTNPTFDGTERRVEAYVLDEDLDLYGEHVAVEFAERLRGMVKFEGVEPLVAQMADDVRRTRDILASS